MGAFTIGTKAILSARCIVKALYATNINSKFLPFTMLGQLFHLHLQWQNVYFFVGNVEHSFCNTTNAYFLYENKL